MNNTLQQLIAGSSSGSASGSTPGAPACGPCSATTTAAAAAATTASPNVSAAPGPGEVIWARSLATPGNDNASAVAVGRQGQVFVGGFHSFPLLSFVASYNSDGAHISTVEFSPPSGVFATFGAMAVDSHDIVWAIGSGSGMPWKSILWQLSGENSTLLATLPTIPDVIAVNFALDPQDNILVTGYTNTNLHGNTNAGVSTTGGLTTSTSLGNDPFLIKLAPNGTRLWTRQWGSTSDEQGFAVAADSDGNAFVATNSLGSLFNFTNLGSQDAYITKFTPDGEQVWTQQLASSGSDTVADVTVGPDGGVYVTGSSSGALSCCTTGSGFRMFVAKLAASNGSVEWLVQDGSSGSYGVAIKCDGAGHAVVLGRTSGDDVTLTKYLMDTGAQLWTNSFGTSSNDYPQALAVAGDVAYVVGYSRGSWEGPFLGGSYDAFAAKVQL
eukprot:m.306747 g.306747  ORF g.306747 m.306747 type:complete len:440 (+) comp23020_c0_seq64:635-1954(+)